MSYKLIYFFIVDIMHRLFLIFFFYIRGKSVELSSMYFHCARCFPNPLPDVIPRA